MFRERLRRGIQILLRPMAEGPALTSHNPISTFLQPATASPYYCTSPGTSASRSGRRDVLREELKSPGILHHGDEQLR
ncbi:hypothetical protein OJAV_G00004920 [Oryzias javanicus]|uniref:Uncharacterized protein n=1 Tax=Oryzias javanicus TaxID=123683 RepID=A0A3S2MHI2_ORYJA|nr:hypothetical protein OJAV_G00004920 [Oryzias javanicus]